MASAAQRHGGHVRTGVRFLAAMAGCLAVLACGGTDSKPGGVDGGGGGVASIRVIHASPDAPAIDLSVRGAAQPSVSNLAYGATSTRFDVPAGSATLDVRPAGAASSTAPVVSTPATTLDAGARYTLVVAGLAGTTAPDSALRVLVLRDGFPNTTGQATRVRIVHAGADAPPVGVDVGDTGTAQLTLARFTASDAQGLTLQSAPVKVALRTGSTRLTSFTLPSVPADAAFYLVVTGLAARPGYDAAGLVLVSSDGGATRQDPLVYALHGVVDAAAVDGFVGASKVVDGAALFGLAAFQPSPGTYTLDLFAHASGTTRPAGAPLASGSTGVLAAGERYLVAATGYLSPPSGQAVALIPVRERFGTPPAGQWLVRYGQFMPDVQGAIDVGTVADSGVFAPFTQTLFPGVNWTSVSPEAGTALAAGTVRLATRNAGTTGPVSSVQGTFAAGQRILYLQVGLGLTPFAAYSARALAVDTSVTPWSVTTLAP